jgi:hypothetical protein
MRPDGLQPHLAGVPEDGYSETALEATLMIRFVVVVVTLTVSIGVLATRANAQSPDPALLAPGQSGRMLAPPRYTEPRPVYTSPRPGGTPPHMTGRRGKRRCRTRAYISISKKSPRRYASHAARSVDTRRARSRGEQMTQGGRHGGRRNSPAQLLEGRGRGRRRGRDGSHRAFRARAGASAGASTGTGHGAAGRGRGLSHAHRHRGGVLVCAL